MKLQQLNRDRELSGALRRLDPPSPTPAQMSALARRIVAGAGPALAARRRDANRWWEYAAMWAGMLLPLGFATALVAAACITWISIAPRRSPSPSPERVALLRAVARGDAPRELVDLALGGTTDAHGASSAGGGR